MKSKNIKDIDFVYNNPNKEMTQSFLQRFNSLISDFAIEEGISFDKINVSGKMLVDIYRRIDQRFDYYLYYHSNEKKTVFMSQTKETALFCYWVIKYKPLYLDKELMDGIWAKTSARLMRCLLFLC